VAERASQLDEDGEVARAAGELVARGSIEMPAHRANDAQAIAALLPAGTAVYLPHLPRDTPEEIIAAMRCVRDAGLEPVPHLAARRIRSREAATALLSAARTIGVRRVLVIGGDQPEASGPFKFGVDLLREGILADCGLRGVALPGYPDGHPHVAEDVLLSDLRTKVSLVREQGITPHVVTQFSFSPERIVAYCSALQSHIPGVAVYCGLPGPASPVTLLKYAQRCGVSASLRALQAQGLGAVRLMTQTEPLPQLEAIARERAQQRAANVAGIHVFSFGGVQRSAAWMQRLLAPAQSRA
jgi:methylenetetrahydrofolate reductase (NADPH)